MNKFYQTFEEVRKKRFDGLIITGAPVEQMEFEEVDYWTELREILPGAESHVIVYFIIFAGEPSGPSLLLWAGKVLLPQKLFGLYTHRVMNRKEPLVRGFDDYFVAPHSAIPRFQKKPLRHAKI